MDSICLFGIPVFGLFEFKISDIWQQLGYRTKLRTTGLMALPLISDFRCLLPENEYFLKSGNRIMTEDTDCVNMCLKIILPKNRKNSKSGNRGWHHAAYSKKKVFR